jgi:hypothetical protein
MCSRSIALALFCLVACAKNTPGQSTKSPAVDIAEAAKADGLTDGTLFDFEQGKLNAGAPPVATQGSNISAALGLNGQRFPGNATLGPFRIGMTAKDVEQVALSHSYPVSMGQYPDGPDAECAGEGAAGGKPLILKVIPHRLDVTAHGGASYNLDLMDDAGQARVSRITWAPAAKAFTSASWSAYLRKTFGKPSFSQVSAYDATLRWCTPGEINCTGESNNRLPALTANDDRLRGGMSLTLTIGTDIEKAGPKLALKPKSMASVNCPRRLTAGEERLYINYLASLGDTFAAEAPTVFRRTRLPRGLQETLLYRLGRPDWLKIVNKDYVARYEVFYSGDPGSYSEVKYVAFASMDGKTYQAIWQGDAKAVRSRYPMPGTPAGHKP